MRITILSFAVLCLSSIINNISAKGQLHHIDSLRLIGIKSYNRDYKFDNTAVGGLSGIDRTPEGTYYIISDDKSEYAPARFYTAHIYYTSHSLDSVVLEHVFFMKNSAQKNYPIATCDPESIRYDQHTHTLLWSSEGIYNKIQPAITRMKTDGSYVSNLPLPRMFCYSTDTTSGLHDNEAIEGISFSSNHKGLWIINESPMYEDGVRAQPYPTQSPLRMTLLDATTGKVKKQYAYMLEPVAQAPDKPKDFFINGVSELMTINDSTLLVIERAYTQHKHNTIRIYEADIKGATDIQNLPKLKGAHYKPVHKRLIADLSKTGLDHIDNIEGVTFGHTLPNGHKTLVFISDNNFSNKQKTQIIVYEVLGH